MKEVFIKYNPYKLETDVKVDGKKLAQNSKLDERTVDGSRLQEWVEDLPQMLIGEYNDTDFEVTFHGTLLDCEDLAAAFNDAQERGELTAKITHKPAKETSDKEALIDAVFAEIQKGPFDGLRDNAMINAFEHAKSSDFEVCVVATMSAGKSTLINAMLGAKLMPSKQEACTAKITKIKDTDVTSFRADVYDAQFYENDDAKPIEAYEHLTFPIMERLNSDENVSVIEVSGNIPFVSAEDVSLVLIDTPGPNNSRDPRHLKVQSKLIEKSSKALVLYIMTGEFGTDDDNALLNRVAKSMAVGGKQSKDRFIFVVNKLDDRKKEDGDTEQTLERVRSYLKTHGVANPNLFPASALPALNIRLIKRNAEVDEDTVDETETKVKKLNRNETLHFETYAVLPPSIRDDINEQIEATCSEWEAANKPTNENPDEALIHTGIVSIEAAIRQYVQKYAKTAKIKNIVDTFLHKLDAEDCFEKTKLELATHQEKSDHIVRMISSIRKKMDDAHDAKKFKDEVDNAVAKVDVDSKEVVEEIVQKFHACIRDRIDGLRSRELGIGEAEAEVARLEKFAKQLEPEFEVELDALIRKRLVDTSNALLDAYKKKLSSLTDEIDIHGIEGVRIDPLQLMGGSVVYDEFSSNRFIKEKEVEDGREYVKNTDKKWYKPWTWFQESGYYRAKYKTVQYIDGKALADDFFKPVIRSIEDNGEAARKYAIEQSTKISDRFNAEFKHLDDVLKAKLTELESYATNQKQAEARIKESELKLEWLEQIKAKVESILEI
jgi:GTPase Era involved in 16S rRNA processing